MRVLNIIDVNEETGLITICGTELGLGVCETDSRLKQNGYKTEVGREVLCSSMVYFSGNNLPFNVGNPGKVVVKFFHSGSRCVVYDAKISITIPTKSNELYLWLFNAMNDMVSDADQFFSDKDDDLVYVALKWRDYSITAHIIDDTRYVINVHRHPKLKA